MTTPSPVSFDFCLAKSAIFEMFADWQPTFAKRIIVSVAAAAAAAAAAGGGAGYIKRQRCVGWTGVEAQHVRCSRSYT